MTNCRSGNFKQKNKPFKSSKKSKTKFKENAKSFVGKAAIENTGPSKLSKKIKKIKSNNDDAGNTLSSKKDCRKSKQKHNRINQNKLKHSFSKTESKFDELNNIVKESILNRPLLKRK